MALKVVPTKGNLIAMKKSLQLANLGYITNLSLLWATYDFVPLSKPPKKRERVEQQKNKLDTHIKGIKG